MGELIRSRGHTGEWQHLCPSSAVVSDQTLGLTDGGNALDRDQLDRDYGSWVSGRPGSASRPRAFRLL